MGRTRMSPLAIRRHEDLESQDFEAIPMYIPSRKGNVALTSIVTPRLSNACTIKYACAELDIGAANSEWLVSTETIHPSLS